VDLGLFLVGGRVAAGVRRRASSGRFVTNAGRGATLSPFAPSARLERLAVAAARAMGLDYAGVDVIETERGPTVLEVNGAPRWRALLEATGRDMADAIVALAASRAGDPSTQPA
jgi:ribosomal protein S6--L-glutamate ligase